MNNFELKAREEELQQWTERVWFLAPPTLYFIGEAKYPANDEG